MLTDPQLREVLRKGIALVLLLLPALCALPVLALVAPPGPIRLAILSVWLILGLSFTMSLRAIVRRLRG